MSIYAANYYSSSLQSKQNGERPMTGKLKDEDVKQKGAKKM